MLDRKDRRILAELDFNARKSDAEIGRAVGLSKQNTRYRINRLMDNGIITGFYPVIDNGAMGYYFCRAFFAFQNITSEIVEEIHSYILKTDGITWSITLEGKYDLGISMWVKDLRDFRKAIQEFLFSYGVYIKAKKESICLDLIHFPIFRHEGKEIGEIHVRSASGQVEIDSIDKKILGELSKNARAPTIAIASKAGLSPNAVKYRISKMVKSGVLKGFRPNIDHRKLGLLNFKLFLYLKELTEESYVQLRKYLKQKGVSYIVEEIGVCDLDIEIMLDSYERLFEFIDSLRKAFPRLISDYEVLLLKGTLKIGYLPVD